MIKIIDHDEKGRPIVEIDCTQACAQTIRQDGYRSAIERLMMVDLDQRRLVVRHLPGGKEFDTSKIVSHSIGQARSRIPYEHIFGYIKDINFDNNKVIVLVSELSIYLTDNESFMDTGYINNGFFFGSPTYGSADVVAFVVGWKGDES
jgi:hypothetical protein